MKGRKERIRSGPFVWQRCGQEGVLRLSRRRILLFCLQGSVTLNFHSFNFTLTPGSVATVDGRLLCKCRCTEDAELLEYLPRDSRYHVCDSRDNRSAFAVLPARERLSDWAAAIVSRIRAGASLGCYRYCSVAVQLRDCSRGQIPYPYSCAPGCPAWNRCSGAAAYVGTVAEGHRAVVTETTARMVVSIVAAVTGIGLWGGLLLYNTIKELLGWFG